MFTYFFILQLIILGSKNEIEKVKASKKFFFIVLNFSLNLIVKN